MSLKVNLTVLHITNAHSAFDDRIFYKELCSLAKRYTCYELVAVPDGKTLVTMGGEKRGQGEYESVRCLAFKGECRNFFIRCIRRFLPFIYNTIYVCIETKRIISVLNKNNIRPDLIHFHDLGFVLSALKLKKKFGCKLVFDSHEFFFVYPLYNGLKLKNCFFASRTLLRWKSALKNTDYVISCTRTMDNLVSLIRKDDEHGIIYNSSMFTPETEKRFVSKNRKLVLLHEGTMSFDRGLKLMIEMFQDEYIREHFQLRIVGTVKGEEKEYYERKCHEYGLTEDNIYFTGWVDYLDVPKALKGDIGILFFEKAFNAFYSMPNKLFNYHISGIPVLATHCADLCDTIEQLGTGVIVERNVESVKNGLVKLVAHYDEYQSHVLEHQKEFYWSSDEERLFSIYERVLS